MVIWGKIQFDQGFDAEASVIVVVFLCVWDVQVFPLVILTYSRINVNIGVNNSKKH